MKAAELAVASGANFRSLSAYRVDCRHEPTVWVDILAEFLKINLAESKHTADIRISRLLLRISIFG